MSADATVEKPRPANCTAARLRALKPGEAFAFYHGDLAADITRNTRGAPAYAQLLTEIDATARELQAAERIDVTVRKVGVTRGSERFTVIEHRAIGLAACADA